VVALPQTKEVEMKFVDSNEPRQMRELLIANGWQQERLNSGDYSFFSATGQSIGIERKTVSDLISSLQGRLPNQFFNLIEDYEIPILLIEGHWGRQIGHIAQSGQIYNVTWEQVWNFVRTWQDRNITIELTTDTIHTLERLDQLYRYYHKPYHSGGIDRNTTGDSRIIALQCQGIGASTAQALLKEFGNLQNIANADYIEMAQAGIGMKKAMAVYNHFRK
jgi:ERCC4-type nuclease